MNTDFILPAIYSYKEAYAFYWKYGTAATRKAYNKNGVEIDYQALETMQVIGGGDFQGVTAKKTGRFISFVSNNGSLNFEEARVAEGDYIASVTGATDKVYAIFVLAI